MFAMAGCKLTQVPPEFGVKEVLPPAHIGDGPLSVVTGRASTVTAFEITDSHPVEDCVYLKLAWPTPIPVTRPLLETVATEGVSDVQVPPTVGLNCVD